MSLDELLISDKESEVVYLTLKFRLLFGVT